MELKANLLSIAVSITAIITCLYAIHRIIKSILTTLANAFQKEVSEILDKKFAPLETQFFGKIESRERNLVLVRELFGLIKASLQQMQFVLNTLTSTPTLHIQDLIDEIDKKVAAIEDL